MHGEVDPDWRQVHANLVRNDQTPTATSARIGANDAVITAHHGIDPRLPTHMLSAVLLNGADYRVIGFRGRSSPGDQCLEALSSVQRATAPFLQAAADALRTHADWLGGAAVRDVQQRLQDLGRHHMKPEEPYHLVALNDGSFYAACSDGTLVMRHPDGQQEIRRYRSPQEASAWISRTVMGAVCGPRSRNDGGPGPTPTAHERRHAEAGRLVVDYRPSDPGATSTFRWTAPRGVRTAEDAIEAFWESCDGDADWVIDGIHPKQRR